MRAAVLLAVCASLTARTPEALTPDALARLFTEWRAFQAPKLVGGVTDYSAGAMAKQHQGLAAFQRRLGSLKTEGWSVPDQVDLEIVRAEMAGLDFDHRVLRPWANNPAFYATVMAEESDQPAYEGPHAAGLVELWRCSFPLDAAQVAALRPGLRAIPGLLDQARRNLVGNGRDLWVHSGPTLKGQAEALKVFAARLEDGDLRAEVVAAQRATEAFAAWVAAQAKTKQGPSGIGVANYTWYLQHVQLLPHTWADEVRMLTRELARAKALLALEEARHRGLPELEPVKSAEEHSAAFRDAVPRYMAFLRDRDLMTLPEDFGPALQARVGAFAPGPHEFFREVDYREPLAMRTHGYHWFDLATFQHRPHPSPIRRVPMLYNAFDTRTEGHAVDRGPGSRHLGGFSRGGPRGHGGRGAGGLPQRPPTHERLLGPVAGALRLSGDEGASPAEGDRRPADPRLRGLPRGQFRDAPPSSLRGERLVAGRPAAPGPGGDRGLPVAAGGGYPANGRFVLIYTK
jgi:hypothetical protein